MEPQPLTQNERRVLSWLRRLREGKLKGRFFVDANDGGIVNVQRVDMAPCKLWDGTSKK